MIFVAPFLLFMGAVFLLPLAFILYTSVVADAFTLDYYVKAFTGTLYLRVAWTTFEISVVSALTTLVLSYPVAYHLSR